MSSAPHSGQPSVSALVRAPASFDSLLELVERALQGPLWVPRAVAAALLLAVFFSVPGYQRTPELMPTWAAARWAFVAHTIRHPFTDLARLHSTETNEAKRTFRLTPVGVAYATRTGVRGALVFDYLCGYTLLHLATLIGQRVFQRRSSAFLVTLLLASSYFGTAAFKDVSGWFDAVAYAYLLAAVYVAAPVWRVLALLAAFFTDERAIAVAPLLLAYPVPGPGRPDLRSRAATLLTAVFVYAGLRLGLTWALGYVVATRGIDGANLHLHSIRWPGGVWSAFEGGWLLVIWGYFVLARGGGRRAILATAGLLWLIAYLASCFLVTDATRSLSYACVALPPLLAALHEHAPRARLQQVLLAAATISLLAPNLFLWDLLDYEVSVPVLVVESFTGRLGTSP